MDEFALRFGNRSITLAQSKQLFGVKPKQDRATDAREAVQRTLPERSWRSAGTVGGFQLVSICDCSVDADQALDKIRLDASVLVGTHVFELPERRGIFVPTGELFVGFKAGTSSEVRQYAINEFGLCIKEARGPEGLVLAVTPQSPNPIKVALGLRQKPFVSTAEPDLASKSVSKLLMRPTDTLPAERWQFRNNGLHRNIPVGFMRDAPRRISDVFSPRRLALAEGVSPRWHFGGVGSMSCSEILPKSEPDPGLDVGAGAPRRRIWTAEQKAQIVAESYAGGGSASAVARRHGLKPQQLFGWRRHARQGEDDGVAFAPIVVTMPAGAEQPRPGAPAQAPTIEIAIGAVTIRVPAGVDIATLQAVLRAVRTMSGNRERDEAPERERSGATHP